MPDVTGCAVCHRAVYTRDVDDEGRCCFCAPAWPPAKSKAKADPKADDAPAPPGVGST